MVDLRDAADSTVAWRSETALPPGRALEGWLTGLDGSIQPFPRYVLPEQQTTAIHQLSFVVVDGGSLSVQKAGTVLADTEYPGPGADSRRLALRGLRLVGSPAVLGANRVAGDYFHWLTQCLPAIDACLSRIAPGAAHLALPPLAHGWQRETLALLGWGTAPTLTLDPRLQYRFNTLFLCDLLVGSGSFAIADASREVYAKLAQAVPSAGSMDRKIYVAAGGGRGKLRNEAALAEMFRQEGYAIVSPGEMSFADQLNLFRNADVIAGPHGAGLSNIVFCRPGARVYEMLPAHCDNPCFCALAQMAGLNYAADVFESRGSPFLHPTARDWEANLETCRIRLGTLS